MVETAITERFTTAAGIRVRYLEAGAGTPVLMLHGGAAGSSGDVFVRNFGPLASHGLRLIAPDLPGVGKTEPPLEPSEAYRRRFLLELLDALGIERPGWI